MEMMFCPKCRLPQNMKISIDEEVIYNENNEKTRTTWKSYTCSVCHMFVKSDKEHFNVKSFVDVTN